MFSRNILIALLCFYTLPSIAQNDTMVKAYVNTTKVGVMQSFEVTFECSATIKQLIPPTFDNFILLQGPYQTTESSTSFINNKINRKSVVKLTYVLQPKQKGLLTIDRVKVLGPDEEEYYSYPISIEVVADSITGIVNRHNALAVGTPITDMMRMLTLPVKGNHKFIIGMGPVYYEKGIVFDTLAFLANASKLKGLPDFKFKSDFYWDGSITYTYPDLPRLYFGVNDTIGLKEKIEPYYSTPGASYFTSITPTEQWEGDRELNLLYALHKLYDAYYSSYDSLFLKPSPDKGKRLIVLTVTIPDKSQRNAFIKKMKTAGYKIKYDDPKAEVNVTKKIKFSTLAFLQHATYILEQGNKHGSNSSLAFGISK